MTSLILFRANDSRAKLSAILQTAERCFIQRQRLLFCVPNKEAADYLDQLLWSTPKESFLPHSIASRPITTPIAITTSQQNVNRAEALFNLCPAISSIPGPFKALYDFYDRTHPDKETLSQKREAEYRALGLHIAYS